MIRPLITAIYAQLTPREGGGVAHAVQQLVAGLGKLTDSDESYVIITSPAGAEWLSPVLGSNQRLVIAPYHLSHAGPRWEATLASLMARKAPRLVPLVQKFWEHLILPVRSRRPVAMAPPHSDGFIESLGAGVVHFPYQRFIRTSIPSIFEPWDLQHRHLPSFFSKIEFRAREAFYKTACEHANTVVVASEWVRQDIIQQFRLPRSKVLLIRRGAPLAMNSTRLTDAEIRNVRLRLKLPEEFVLYPAHTWPHKNHVRLLESIALLRDRQRLRINVICTGALTPDFPRIQRRLQELRLGDQVRFLDFVSPTDLRVLYRSAQFLIMPSLFEGYGFPVLEAFHEELAVGCSRITSLPELVGEAGLLFDPTSVEEIADAIQRLWSDTNLRRALVQRGTDRLRLFDDVTTARTYRALYRHLTGRSNIADDRVLLDLAIRNNGDGKEKRSGSTLFASAGNQPSNSNGGVGYPVE